MAFRSTSLISVGGDLQSRGSLSIEQDMDILALNVALADTPISGYAYPTLWVNGTILTEGNGFSTPKPSYPYKRLAGLGGYNSTSFSVYHQVNATSFAEDVWHVDLGIWTSTDITVGVK